MTKFIKTHKKLSIKILIILILITLFVVFLILKNNKDNAESWSSTFVQGYIVVVGTITKPIPFSILEISALLFIGFIIFFLVKVIINLVKKRFWRSLSHGLNIVLMIFALLASYQITAEMMYNRKPVEVPLYEKWVEKEHFKEIINYFIDDINECCNHLEFLENGDLKAPDVAELNKKVEAEYKKFESTYLFDFTTETKPMYLLSWLYTEFHITGITFIPLGEANINILNVNAGKGFTTAHELAHTKGAMREEDADLVASYITLHSDDYYLRYSGYYYTLGSLMSLANYTGVEGDYNALYARIDNRYKKNMSFNNQYWKEHNKAKDFATWWNNLYLQLSGEKDGTSSYGDSATIVDPTKKEIKSFSNYQKLFFDIYYSKHSI